MITVPLSVYGLTLLQKKLCEPLVDQLKLVNGYKATPMKAPDRDDWRQSDYYHAYEDWCQKQNLPIGTKPKPLSSYKLRFIGTACLVLGPLKHIVGCVESIVRIPLSMVTHLVGYAMKAPLINRAFSDLTFQRLELVNNSLKSPLSNADRAIDELCLVTINLIVSVSQTNFFFPNAWYKYNELHANYVSELSTATNSQLWQLYREARELNHI